MGRRRGLTHPLDERFPTLNRSLAALTLVAAALPSAAAAQAADPSKVVATVPDAADKGG